jgi:MFS family permease
MNATFRSLGVLCGPVVGSALMLLLGTTGGIFANALIYLPMTLLMLRTPWTGHVRSGFRLEHRPGLRETWAVLRSVAHDRVLFGMILLAGLAALAIGGSLQVSIPDFATGNLAIGESGLGYGVLLFAGGVGGVIGGFLLEVTGVVRPTIRAVVVSTVLFGLTTVTVALTHHYAVAVTALVIGGFANLASTSVSQAIVQMRARTEERGRVVGVYAMVGSGLRTGNGLSLALLGSWWGIGPAVAIGGAFLVVATLTLGIVMSRRRSV